MPLIDYTCSVCGETFEKFLFKPTDVYEGCKLCSKGPSHRIISLVNFIADNTGEAIARKAKRDANRMNSKIRQMDPNALEDVYGTEKAREIYKGAEDALHCKPRVRGDIQSVKNKLKHAKIRKATKKKRT